MRFRRCVYSLLMKRCIYAIHCDGKVADSRDHVPPCALLKESTHINLLTVPSCKKCNEKFSEDEEYFRLVMVGLCCHTQEANELFDGPISRSMDYIEDKEDKTFDHSLRVEGDAVVLDVEYDRIYRIAEKIARGLRYLRVGEAHTPKQSFEVDFFEVDGPSAVKTFSPHFTFNALDQDSMSWEFTLFDSLRFIVKAV